MLIKKLIVFCMLLTSFAAISINAVGAVKAGAQESSAPGIVDPSEIYEILAAARDENTSTSNRIDSIRYAAKFPFYEVYSSLIALYDQELTKAAGSDNSKFLANFKIIYHLVIAIGDVATANEKEQVLAEFTRLVSRVALLPETEQELLTDAVYRAYRAMDEKIAPLPRLPKITNKVQNQEKSFKDRLDQFENKLEEIIEGQPQAVNKMVKLRARDLFYGYRDDPAFMWFLGPPGTGKDTAVRGYLQAIHGDPNAYQTHMFRVDPLRNEGDLWALLGSATGYVGSNQFPPILRFLVEHSAGRYFIEEINGHSGVEYQVVENAKWKSGMILPGYSSPDRGVVYLDEFHDWASKFKNAVAKKSIEYGGYWKINNPNGGLSEIYVPINIIAASNDGIELVTSREKNGQRFGRPLTYEEMKQKADRIRNNPVALKNSILRGNGEANSPNGDTARGTSEEFLNRVPDDHLVWFDPLSPESLKKIAEKKLQVLRAGIQRSQSGFNKINLSWTPGVVSFLQEYHYIAEDQARPIETRVRSLIEATIIKAVREGKINPLEQSNVKIDVVKNADNTWQMKFEINNVEFATQESTQIFDMPIDGTAQDKARQPITDERIEELSNLNTQLKKKIVGQSHVIDDVARAIVLSEEGRQGYISAEEAKEKARVFMFLGPTSTGKTETSKVMAETLFGSRLAAVTIDCTSLQSIEAMHKKFLGHKDSAGNAIASDFMKHFDRNAGRLVVVLDELANVQDKNVLNSLFDILREPVVSTFSDGQDRVMSNVVIVITGNASQEILAQLPNHLPEDVLREAWSSIYDQLESDPQMRRGVLDSYFTAPFIARIGDNRIFFYKPLSYADVRNLVQMKFENLISQLTPQDGRRGWEIRIPTAQDYVKIMDALETHGFKVKEQGASIDNYVMEVFGKELRATLLLNKVPSGERVTMTYLGAKNVEQNSQVHAERYELNFQIRTASGQTLDMSINGKPVEHLPEAYQQDQLITASHEVGHVVSRLSLMSDFQVPTNVKILPGVARIGGEWLYYAGLARSAEKITKDMTREYLIRQVSTLLGGSVAENLVIRGGLNGAGRSNDIQRATDLIERGILEFGMSPTFGMVSLKKSELSETAQDLLRTETQKIMLEAEVLSQKALQANKALFVAMTNELARKGELNDAAIHALVKKFGLVRDYDRNFADTSQTNAKNFNNELILDRPGMKYEFMPTLGLISVNEVVDIQEIVRQRKIRELNGVSLPENASILDSRNMTASSKKASKAKSRKKKTPCENLLS